MRSKKEILDDILVETTKVILEVVIDIRDLLVNMKEEDEK